MTVAALPVTQRRFASPPAARRSRKAMSTPPPQNSLQAPRPHPPPSSSPSKKHVVFIPADNTSRLRPRPPHRRSIRDLQIPIACAQPSRRPILPAVSSRRPRVKPRAPAKGRRPKPFSVPDGRSRREAVIGVPKGGHARVWNGETQGVGVPMNLP